MNSPQASDRCPAFIKAAAIGLRDDAVENDIITEALVPTVPSKDEVALCNLIGGSRAGQNMPDDVFTRRTLIPGVSWTEDRNLLCLRRSVHRSTASTDQRQRSGAIPRPARVRCSHHQALLQLSIYMRLACFYKPLFSQPSSGQSTPGSRCESAHSGFTMGGPV
jgi:hypothetical protein